MWLGKSVLSKALILAKKQLESLSVSSLIHKKQSTCNSLYIIIYIGLTSIIKNILYPNFVVEIQETIPTYTKTATTSPPAHSSCLIKSSLHAQCQHANAISSVHNSALARKQCP
ncbi:hypothetical protein YC2023_022045 [Brassica napus]